MKQPLPHGASLELKPYTLTFKEPAGTSRGVYHTRPVWYVEMTDSNGRWGVGECAPLLDLSMEAGPDFERRLTQAIESINHTKTIDWQALETMPSLVFALEGILKHFTHQTCAWGNSSFVSGTQGIVINGLVWMGDFATMKTRLEAKRRAGFRCIKLKIGAIDFDDELALLHEIRRHLDKSELELRVDANGAFSPEEVMDKLKALAEFDLHSIEQPIKPGQWEVMHELCRTSPIAIGLDEELIGVVTREQKIQLLQSIQPQYLVLKPTLHGGLAGSSEWITLAREHQAQAWVTSALESNVGLNTIAQWVSTLHLTLPQGLGTGALYTTNVDMPLQVMGDALYYTGGDLSRDWWTRLTASGATAPGL